MTKAINVSQTANATFGFKNRIINGGMTIDQRNAGAAVTTNAALPVDRFLVNVTSAGTFSAQQSSAIVPNNFVNSLGFTVTSSDGTLDATDSAAILHWIEGNNIADLGFGTAAAKNVTLSFWARASVIGTYCAVLLNSSSNGTAAPNRSYVSEYSITSANTWEYKTITIPGDTSGTWHTGNNRGALIRFGLSAGTSRQQAAGSWGTLNAVGSSNQTNIMATSGATFYITGVQLEKGSVATDFDFRSIGTELALCQRYYYRLNGNASAPRAGAGYNATTTVADYVFSFPVQMRIDITALEQSGTASHYNIAHGATNTNCSSVPTYLSGSKDTIGFRFTVASGLTAGQGSLARLLSVNAFLGFSAEL